MFMCKWARILFPRFFVVNNNLEKSSERNARADARHRLAAGETHAAVQVEAAARGEVRDRGAMALSPW
jgi:hypothetical protein